MYKNVNYYYNILGGYVDLHSIPTNLISFNTVSAMEPSANNVSAETLKTPKIFEEISKMIKEDSEAAKRINAVFAYKITKDGKNVADWSK